ncbi:hypothetical protein [Paraburkholderia sp.]|uniref:hypothetical protein n=1 Tax=Paraburkholderia sp. TaxID=1926495 RepID=UPI0039E300C2
MKVPNWSRFAAAGAIAAAIVGVLSDATTLLTNAKSMMSWPPFDKTTTSSQTSQRNLPKLTAIASSVAAPVSAANSTARAASSVFLKDVDNITVDHRPKVIRRKLILGLPVEFTPDLSLVIDHIYGVDSQYTVGLRSPAWGNEVLELKPGGEPFEVTVSHVRYGILVRDVRADAQGNIFVDVTATQHP